LGTVENLAAGKKKNPERKKNLTLGPCAKSKKGAKAKKKRVGRGGLAAEEGKIEENRR